MSNAQANQAAFQKYAEDLLADPDLDVAKLEDLAARKDLPAIAALSIVYHEGTAMVTADFMKAYQYAKLGASLKDPVSTFSLAKIQYRAGERDKAVESAKAAYEGGVPDAGLMYGQMLLKGEGTAKSPLDALAILSDLAKTNAQAAIASAEFLLDIEAGRGIPQGWTRAYDLLIPHEVTFDTLNRPQRIQAYKAMWMCLLRNARKSPLGRDSDFYIEAAAKLGDKDAKALLNDVAKENQRTLLAEEWDKIAKFDACGGEWEMFTSIGTLVEIEYKSNTGLYTMNGATYSNTVRWNSLHFRGINNDTFTVGAETRHSAVRQRPHVVLYVGTAGSKVGIPMMVFDPQGGTSFPSTANLWQTFPQNWSKWGVLGSWLVAPVGIFIGIQGIMAMLMLFAGAFSPFLLGAGMTALGVFMTKWGWTLRKRYSRRNYKKALHAAAYFVGRHGQELLRAAS